MKLALITTNLSGGGAERVLLRWSELLGARGHEVHIVLLEHRVDHALPEAVRVHALTAPGRSCRKGYIGKRLGAWRLARKLAELTRDKPFDLHISTLPFADEVARLARLPRLWNRIANTLSAEIARLDGAKARRRTRRYRRLYAGGNLIAVSDGVAADLRHRLQIAAARIERIYNPYDFAAIRAQAALVDAADTPPREPFIVHVGRFRPQKRHDLLLDAYAQAALDERLVLLCERDATLVQMIADRAQSARVTIAGFKTNPYPWMAAARALVLSSDHEGLPNVLVEALACGTPVVSTDCPSGPSEILTGALATGLVPCNDPAALAGAMRAAVRQPRRNHDAALSAFAASTIVAQLEALAVT